MKILKDKAVWAAIAIGSLCGLIATVVLVGVLAP